MLSSMRLLTGVRELVQSHALSIPRRSAVGAQQKRCITIEQLNDGRDSKCHVELAAQSVYFDTNLPHNNLLTNIRRPRARRNPRIRLGRLHSRANPRPLEIPSRRRISPILFRLHPAARQHRSWHTRVPHRARTSAQSAHQSGFLPGLG